MSEEMRPISVEDVATQVRGHGTGLTVITGGEPLLQQYRPGWIMLLELLGWDIEVETNGTRAPSEDTARYVTRFNVSPKLAHAGDPYKRRIRLDVLRQLRDTGRAIFKFVARDSDDLDEIADICTAAGIPDHLVWVMPEGTTAGRVVQGMRNLADPVIARGWNLTTRMHVLIWGDERRR